MEGDINPFAMLEVSLVEDNEQEVMLDFPNPVPESIQVEVDPLEIGECLDVPRVKSNGESSVEGARQLLIKNAGSLSQVTAKEQLYRHHLYQTLNIVLKKRLHCTICDRHIGCSLEVHDSRVIHPLLKVLICIPCSTYYTKVSFVLGPTGNDVLCRWCGKCGEKLYPKSQSMGLRWCSTCPYAFCEGCIYRNFPLDEPGKPDPWVCFVCNMIQLWPHRALSWALVSLLNNLASRKIKDPIWSADISECCRKIKQKKDSNINQTPSNIVPNPISIARSKNHVGRGGARSVVPNPHYNNVANINQKMNGEIRKIPMDTLWLKSKIKCISANMVAIDRKLVQLRESLPDTDTEENLSKKMESLHSLLILARKQIEEYDADLKRDWTSRRFNRTDVLFRKSLNNVANHSRSNQNIRRLNYPSQNKINKKTTSYKRPNLGNHRSSNSDLTEKFNVKPCYIKLERFTSPNEV